MQGLKTYAAICIAGLHALAEGAQLKDQHQDRAQASDQVNVFFVPHSHLDAGWNDTYDTLYETSAIKLFMSVFELLAKRPDLRYTIGDIAFFQRFYEKNLDDQGRQVIKRLIQNKQVEIVHGGMMQPDEATTKYADILRTFEAGHSWLQQEFGVKPTVGWQLDPWGHSTVMADIFAELGMEAMFFARMTETLKQQYIKDGKLEFIWEPDFDGVKQKREIFAHMHLTHYNPQGDLNFMDRKIFSEGMDYSLKDAEGHAENWFKMLQSYEDAYQTNNILVFWGDDYAHLDAVKTYAAAEKTMKVLNEKQHEKNKNYNFKWAGVGEYVDAVFKDAKAKEVQFPRVERDFYGYRRNENEQWTGFMSSLPDFKRAANAFTDFAEATEQVLGFSADSENEQHIKSVLLTQQQLLSADGLMQHHDAMTGTHSMKVDEDYLTTMKNQKDVEYDENIYGGFARNVKKIAESFGVQMSEITQCEFLDGSELADQLETHKLKKELQQGIEFASRKHQTRPSVGGHTLDCLKGPAGAVSRLISVYNPNIDAIDGLFFSIELEQSHVKITKVGDTAKRVGDTAQTEVLCQSSRQADSSGSDACLAFLSTRVEGLSFSFFTVELQQEAKEKEILTPQVLFSDGPNAHHMSKHFTAKLSDGQSLKLRQIENLDDPIVLTYKSSKEENSDGDAMAFTISQIRSENKPALAQGERPRVTGLYSFSAYDAEPELERLLSVRDVSVIEGLNVAQVDITYTVERQAARQKSQCEKRFAQNCAGERDRQKNALLTQCAKEGIFRRRLTALADNQEQMPGQTDLEKHCMTTLQNRKFDCPGTQHRIDECSHDQSDMTEGTGRVTFMIMKNHSTIHQKVTLPRLPIEGGEAREIFAIWEPFYDSDMGKSGETSTNFQTDANALTLLNRSVAQPGEGHFEDLLVPINSVISVSDANGERRLSVKNDRSQGGLVHSDGSIMLLIDRRFIGKDSGGVETTSRIDWEFATDLVLNFNLQMSGADELPSPQRQRGLQALQAAKFQVTEEVKDCDSYRNHFAHLREFLRKHNVKQISLTRLPQSSQGESSNLRVRLDLDNPKDNFLIQEDLLNERNDTKAKSPLDDLAKSFCSLLTWAPGASSNSQGCESQDARVTGLVGINPSLERRLFSTFEKESLRLDESTFVTFEINVKSSPDVAPEQKKKMEGQKVQQTLKMPEPISLMQKLHDVFNPL